MMKRNVFIYGFGSADCHDNNRNMSFLGDFEDTVMKRQKLKILAPCSFRIDGNGTFIRLNQMRGILNGCKCLLGFSRSIAMKQHFRIRRPQIGILKLSALDIKARSLVRRTCQVTIGSSLERWLQTRRKRPVSGRCSMPLQ